jgi:hypothetical protein
VTAQLAELVADFARGIEAVDSAQPQAINQRSKVAYQPGIGPHTEIGTVELVMTELAHVAPERYSQFKVGVPYEDGSRQKCDLGLGEAPSWSWLIEVKMIRMLSNNAKRNDNLPTHILSPSPPQRCYRLRKAGVLWDGRS